MIMNGTFRMDIIFAATWNQTQVYLTQIPSAVKVKHHIRQAKSDQLAFHVSVCWSFGINFCSSQNALETA